MATFKDKLLAILKIQLSNKGLKCRFIGIANGTLDLTHKRSNRQEEINEFEADN